MNCNNVDTDNNNKYNNNNGNNINNHNNSELYSYTTTWPIYSLNWSVRNDPRHKYRLAVGSFLEDTENFVQIIQLDEVSNRYNNKGIFNHNYPPTKIMFIPDKNSTTTDLIATSSDYLYLWAVDKNDNITRRAIFDSSPHYCAPITSFDWNDCDFNLIGASSIDGTCTIWDVELQKIHTQLIAHETEVNDIAFSNERNIFTSVGADGSIRIFDLRRLEHSTVLYDNDNNIIRVSWNKYDPYYIAAIIIDSLKTILIDVRMPTRTVIDLIGHNKPVNCICFSPHSICHICTAGEDSQALIWNLSQITHPIDPILSYRAESPINSLQWSVAHPDWISVGFHNTVQILRV